MVNKSKYVNLSIFRHCEAADFLKAAKKIRGVLPQPQNDLGEFRSHRIMPLVILEQP